MDTSGLVIFYGATALLAREAGVPVFINGDTCEIEVVQAGERLIFTEEEFYDFLAQMPAKVS